MELRIAPIYDTLSAVVTRFASLKVRDDQPPPSHIRGPRRTRPLR
jgi:hypothetical protein